MSLIDIDAPAAAKMLADEAAAKLEPILLNATAQLGPTLQNALDGLTITITVKKKDA